MPQTSGAPDIQLIFQRPSTLEQQSTVAGRKSTTARSGSPLMSRAASAVPQPSLARTHWQESLPSAWRAEFPNDKSARLHYRAPAPRARCVEPVHARSARADARRFPPRRLHLRVEPNRNSYRVRTSRSEPLKCGCESAATALPRVRIVGDRWCSSADLVSSCCKNPLFI